MAAEGYVDGKAAQAVVEVIHDVAEQIDTATTDAE